MKKIYRIWQGRHQETLVASVDLMYFEKKSEDFPVYLYAATATISFESSFPQKYYFLSWIVIFFHGSEVLFYILLLKVTISL